MRHQQLPAPDEFHVLAGDDAVGSARRRIVRTAPRWSLPFSDAALADVELCASEVITNALTPAGDECWVRTHWTGQFLHVEVTDRSLRPPLPCTASTDDTGGRGLAMVECLSLTWGWEPKELGKTVFFVVAGEAVLTERAGLSALVQVARTRITHVRTTVAGRRRHSRTHTRRKILRILTNVVRWHERPAGAYGGAFPSPGAQAAFEFVSG